MYGNTSAAGGIMTGSLLAANSGWTVAGWLVLGTSVLLAGAMTIGRLARRGGG